MKCEHCGAEFEVEERITKITKRREIDSIVIDEKIQESLRFCSYDCQLQHQQYVCEHCHKNFTPKSLNQVFCSSECRILASNAPKKKEPTDVLMCEVCGKEFTPKGKRGPVLTVCSPRCRHERDKKKRNEKPKTRLVCEYCGKFFFLHRDSQKFCSHECAAKASRSLKGTRKICVYCGKEFEPKSKNQICCSFECGSLQSATHRKKQILTCLCCGKEFEARRDNKGFCSKKCARRYISDNKQNKCSYCGVEFKGPGKYCSDECREKAKIKHKTCSVCGKEFTTTGRQSICSDECRKQLARDKQHQIYLSKRDEEIRRLREEFVPQRVV
ncbi:MAG TPA: hypothetical protein PLW97_12710, partial [Synergistaceae bacterium]|nr:hypothetical protein [Synergistaceae bacterium]